MAVSVADLAKYYADTPPPKYDTLADLEARLEELRAPGQRSPFKFDTSLGVGPFGTTGYGTIGTYGSVAEFLKATVPHVSSLYPVHRAGGLAAPFTTPSWEQLVEKRRTSPWSINVGNVQYDRENPFGGVLEALRPQLERFGVFVGGLPAGLERTLKALRSTRPLDPYGNPVPLDNMWLYSLARRAYQGDYAARAAFLDEIGADESADNVLYVEELLRPTFAPARLDLREPWEQRGSREARRWLNKSLGDLKRKNERESRIFLPYEEEDEKAREELFAFADAESQRAKEAKIRSALPERQYQVLMLLAEGRKQREIAEELNIGLSTVKTHAGRLRENPELLRALSS